MLKGIALFDPAGSGQPLKQAAKRLGYKVVGVFTAPPHSFEEIYHANRSSLHRDCDAVIESRNEEEIIQKLKALPFPIIASIAATEGGVEWAENIAHKLHLLSNSAALTQARRDKGEMRKRLKESGLSCPDFAICSHEEEIIAFGKSHRFPLMVKTPKGVMTSQVYECSDGEALFAAFHSICNNRDIYGVQTDHCIVEEYISGPEYIVNTFSDGTTVYATDVWIYEKIHSDHFKNIYYNAICLPLYDPALRPIIEYGIEIAKVYGIVKGAAHIELKDDPVRGPTLIEIGARLSGAKIPELIKKYTNFDPFEALIEVFVSGKTIIPHPIVYQKHLAIACFPQLKGGKVKQILGLEAIEQLSSYDSHVLSIKKGDLLSPSSHGGTIPLFCFFAHAQKKQLLRDIDQAHALFRIEYEI